MPTFRKTLTDDQTRAFAEYLKGLLVPERRTPLSVELQTRHWAQGPTTRCRAAGAA